MLFSWCQGQDGDKRDPSLKGFRRRALRTLTSPIVICACVNKS
ncbi:hypothetical protein X975_14467, partial [Stegodyphus mimosarum]